MGLRRVRHVDFSPSSGWLDRPWDHDPDIDAFARSSRRVCERYTELLQGAQLASNQLRIFLRMNSAKDIARVEFLDGEPTDFESALAYLPRGLTDWTPTQRARLALELQHASALALARVRGSDPAPFGLAHHALLLEGLQPLWHGPWTSSPSRKHRARLVQRIEDTGFAKLWLEVCLQGQEGSPIGRTEAINSPGNLIAFARASCQRRWQDAKTLRLISTDWLGMEVGSLTTTLADLLPIPDAAPTVPVAEVPCQIEMVSRLELEAASPPSITVGGRFNGYPKYAPDEVRHAWRRFADLSHLLLDWWATSGWGDLVISAHADLKPARSSTSKTGLRGLSVDICRSRAELRDTDPVDTALAMVEEAIRLISRRTRIPATPVPPRIVEAMKTPRTSPTSSHH